MRKHVGLLAVALTALAAGPISAQTTLPDLANATLEELMNIEVTSVSRREQRAEDVAASLHVISRDEIHRSGLTSIAEVLRLAPGVQVSRLNANKWSVSVRGFNSLASSKLLVMVDGRSLYNPAYSTVLWDTEDLLLEDVERIEVIRGPGGAMWGANAVNGVINIITRPSDQTRGGFARVSGGTFDSSGAAFRYGGGMGALTYRAFAQASTHGASRHVAGGSAGDSWRSATAGIRTDWTGSTQTVMFQAATTVGEQRPLWIDPTTLPLAAPASGPVAISHTRVSHALGRWTRTGTGGDILQVQGYVDENRRDEFIGFYHRATYDGDVQYTSAPAAGHSFVAGGGLRSLDERIAGRGPFSFTPGEVRSVITNVFAQDSIDLAGDRAEVTVGAKFEHSTFTGSAFQPSARVMVKPARQHRLWASVARAVRTPSLVDRGFRVELPPVPLPGGLTLVAGAVGNPELEAERLLDVEAGYRVNLGGRVSVDAVAFRGRYDDATIQEPPAQPTMAFVAGRPVLYALATYHNGHRLLTKGAEISARATLTPFWSADASVSLFRAGVLVHEEEEVPVVALRDDTAGQQWRLHSAWSLGARRVADLRLMRVSAVEPAQIPAYTRVDARFEWGLTKHVSIAADGQNLLSSSHLESSIHDDQVMSTRVPRSGHIGLLWRF
jgi:iron complex outermembrane recepter protein